jgi:hypothetical protein
MLLSLTIDQSQAFHCPEKCNYTCPKPSCCPGTTLVLDSCGCCVQNATTEGETCGGHFPGPRCGVGLSCFRQCGCSTTDKAKCVFPFRHKGVEHRACTREDAEDGKSWCATQVTVGY